VHCCQRLTGESTGHREFLPTPLRYKFVDRRPYKEIYRWLAAADVLVNLLPDHPKFKNITTTLKEFEYMTAQRPIVVSELRGSREVLFNNINALVIPPSSEVEFSKAVLKLFDHPDIAENIAAKAREDVSKKTWDARANRITEWIVSRT
jgi:glycosyltransferase involved in cell wall biosynthesis